MRRTLFFLILLFLSVLCFAQQNSNFRVIGRVPGADDNRLYQIQVGAFRFFQNAEGVYERLNNASLNPVYENFLNLTRVVINGVAARDVPSYLQRIQNTGFTEVIVRVDSGRAAVQSAGIAGIVEGRTPAAVIEETPPLSVPVEEDPIVEPDPTPVVPGQLLPAPENRRPQEGYRIGAEELRQQRSIVFSWDAVEGATAYILTIRETSQERRQIFITEPMEQLNFTFENLKLFDYNGTYVWQVEALRRSSQGNIEQRGRPGENTFTLNVPRPGRVRTKNTGVLYGN
ncbi:MAG: hypothetical protein LBQ89_04980 [Treponema sp.]|jgi:hypothetical protein|nr:hypothetical protein [Treponema sp.]